MVLKTPTRCKKVRINSIQDFCSLVFVHFLQQDEKLSRKSVLCIFISVAVALVSHKMHTQIQKKYNEEDAKLNKNTISWLKEVSGDKAKWCTE